MNVQPDRLVDRVSPCRLRCVYVGLEILERSLEIGMLGGLRANGDILSCMLSHQLHPGTYQIVDTRIKLLLKVGTAGGIDVRESDALHGCL